MIRNQVTRMLHKTFQIYHRDLSPGNLLVTEDHRPFDEETLKLESMGFSHCLFDHTHQYGLPGHHDILLTLRLD
jgi:hypothetical protein